MSMLLKIPFVWLKRIRAIFNELFEGDYRFVLFDIESLFTSIPLRRTINIIIDRTYNQNLLITYIKKRTLQKLLKDCSTKNAFTFNNVIYEQMDCVSMESCVRLTLANIIMTELEVKVGESLFKDGLLKFFIRYVNDTLALIKQSDIDHVLSKLNGFHPSPNFTVDKFDDVVMHYLDLKIIDNETDIYYKDAHTGQYMHLSSYTPWNIKTAGIIELRKYVVIRNYWMIK